MKIKRFFGIIWILLVGFFLFACDNNTGLGTDLPVAVRVINGTDEPISDITFIPTDGQTSVKITAKNRMGHHGSGSGICQRDQERICQLDPDRNYILCWRNEDGTLCRALFDGSSCYCECANGVCDNNCVCGCVNGECQCDNVCNFSFHEKENRTIKLLKKDGTGKTWEYVNE